MKMTNGLGVVAVQALVGVCLLGIPLSQCAAATNDVTGLTPTLHVTFDNSSVVNDNGTASMTIASEGTTTYVTAPNGKAIDTLYFTPYSSALSGLTTAGGSFSVSAFCTLGTTVNGLAFHLRDNNGTIGGLVMRRGSTTNQVVVTLGTSTTPLITVNNVPAGDYAYHHYALVATSSGVTLYIDGTSVGSTPSNTVSVSKMALQFGSRHGGVLGGEAKNGGKLDDFRVYGDALTANQIVALTTALTVPGMNAGLISIKTGPRGSTLAEGNITPFTTAGAGAVPEIAGLWNKTPYQTGGSYQTVSNLLNSAGVTTGAKMYYAIPNTWYCGVSSATANESLTRTYFDDGGAGSYTINEGGLTNVVLPNPGITRGWQVMLTGVPYQHADLYLIFASDQAVATCRFCPALVKVGDAAWTYYYGISGIEKTVVGNQNWSGLPFSTGALKEGVNYLKIPLSNLTTNTPISIAHGARITSAPLARGSLAGIQIVKRDSAASADDTYYQRTVTGAANWSAAAWDNAGTSLNVWSNSTDARKTTAVLTTSGSTTLALPEESVTAEAVSVRGSGPFTLGGPGALNLNGAAVIDAYGMAATDIVTIDTAIQGSNVTVSANNAGTASAGYTRLTCTTNAFSSLTLTKGTLLASSVFPAGSGLTLGGGILMFTGSGVFTNPVQIAADSKIRVAQGQSVEISSALSGTGSVSKADTGSLTLSAGGSFKNLQWENTGSVRLTGAAPFAFNSTVGNGYTNWLEITAPTTLSGILSLGAATLPLDPGASLTANALRWSDTGTYTTTVSQTGGRLTILGSNNAVSTSDSVLFSHYAGLCNYALSGGDFLASNAVALLAWDGATTWTIGGHAYVKGVNMRGSTKAGMFTTLALNGGTLEVGGSGIFASQTSSSRAVNLSTGTLRATTNFTFASSAVSSAVNLTDAATGVSVNPNGYVIGWAAPLTGAGKLVLNDSAATPGKLILSGTSTHSGGVDLLAGTLVASNVAALGTGPVNVSSGTLDVGPFDVSCGALTVTSATLGVRLGMVADLSNSGSLTASSLTLSSSAPDAIKVVLDLNGIDAPLIEYPIILSPSLPAGLASQMTVAFTNGGPGLLASASVALDVRAGGVYAVFSGTVPPKNLFWSNGVASGNWSTFVYDKPWGADSVGGVSTNYDSIDTVNFTDTDQPAVAVNVQSPMAPVAMNINNAATAYTFAQGGSGSIAAPSGGLTKSGTGAVTLNVPLIVSNATLTVAAGALRANVAVGLVSSSTLVSPLSVASNATFTYGGGDVQVISGSYVGAGTLGVSAGRMRITSTGSSFSGAVVASGGVMELALASQFLNNNAAQLRVEAGATMELTALDASGYSVTNGNPIDVYGTLKVLQRDSTARGLKLHNGAQVLLKGSNMDSSHAMDLFNTPIISLDAGAASFLPLDANDATQATIVVRTEHMLKTFDVQASNAVLTVATPLIGGYAGNILDKVGLGTLKWTGANTTVAKLRVSAGTFEIGGAGTLGAGASAQEIEILSNATFRCASSTNQTLSGAITCSGLFAKSGSGRLAVSGSLTVNVGGELAIPAVVAEADAVTVSGSSLTVNGVIRVSNFGSLLAGRTYTLLTSAQTLPAGIAATVTGIPDMWKAEAVNDGKTLIIYKKLGSLIMLN